MSAIAPPAVIDLRSDTVTRPTPAMRRAMAEAPVGDDVYGEDPTVNRLEAMAAERLGKDMALFVPSGTMANQIAIRCQTQPGDEVLVEAGAHPLHYEAGAPALISGVLLRAVAGQAGVLDARQLAEHFRPEDVHVAPLTLVCVEDTANRGGGTVWPLQGLDDVAKVAHDHGAAAHMDGARLFNAVVSSGIAADRRVARYDTVSFCLSKGLGAPVGSLLCGSASLIKRARRVRKALGGGMRQAGILAAAGVYALEHHVGRLGDDHDRAEALGEGLRHAGYQVAPIHTNMVFLTVPDAGALTQALADRGIAASAVSSHKMRLVTHLDIDDPAVRRAIQVFDECAPGQA